MEPSTGERGDTLIEVLIALAIMGILTVGLFPAVASSLSSAHRLRNHAQIAEVMSTAVEAFQRAAWKTDCDYSADFTTALVSVTILPKPSISQSMVSKWDGNDFVLGCPDPAVVLPALQIIRLRLTVIPTNGPSIQWVELVKRK